MSTKKRPPRAFDADTPTARHASGVVVGYPAALAAAKAAIQAARTRAVLAVNSELISLYWDLGRLILDRQAAEGYGTKVVDRLSGDLRREFPTMRGLSPGNLGEPSVDVISPEVTRIVMPAGGGVAGQPIASYLVGRSRFVLVEVYRNQDAPAQHKETAHYQAWREAVAPMMAEPRTSVRFVNLHPDEAGW